MTYQKIDHGKCFWLLASLAFHGAQLGSYDVNVVQVDLEYINKMCVNSNNLKTIAITCFSATLAILDTNITITQYLVIVAT